MPPSALANTRLISEVRRTSTLTHVGRIVNSVRSTRTDFNNPSYCLAITSLSKTKTAGLFDRRLQWSVACGAVEVLARLEHDAQVVVGLGPFGKEPDGRGRVAGGPVQVLLAEQIKVE